MCRGLSTKRYQIPYARRSVEVKLCYPLAIIIMTSQKFVSHVAYRHEPTMSPHEPHEPPMSPGMSP